MPRPSRWRPIRRRCRPWRIRRLGIVALKTGDDAGAEKELKAAAEANPGQPDPYLWYHLALAQDHQKKYDEALVSMKQALQDAASNPDTWRAGARRAERDC